MVGELHPAGRWQRVVARDPSNSRSDGSNANIFYASRGEQLSIDLSSLAPEVSNTVPGTDISTTPNNRFQVILPLAREGDVVRIRDVNESWGQTSLGTRSQPTGIDVWTTPFDYRGDSDAWEWGARTPGAVDGSRPLTAHSSINNSNRSRLTVSGNGNTPISAEPLFPESITVSNADLEFIYVGHSKGWVVNTSSSFNPDNTGNLALDFTETDPNWIATFIVNSDGDSEPGYSLIYPIGTHAKGPRPITQVEERMGGVFRAADMIVDVVAAADYTIAFRDDTNTPGTTGTDTDTTIGDIVISVSGDNRFTGRIIASNGI